MHISLTVLSLILFFFSILFFIIHKPTRRNRNRNACNDTCQSFSIIHLDSIWGECVRARALALASARKMSCNSYLWNLKPKWRKKNSLAFQFQFENISLFILLFSFSNDDSMEWITSAVVLFHLCPLLVWSCRFGFFFVFFLSLNITA